MSLRDAEVAYETYGTDSGNDWDSASEPILEIAHADFIASTDWKLAAGPWQDLKVVLLDHQEQKSKDGPCFVPGRLRAHQRKETDVEALALAVLDLEYGEDIQELRRKVKATGYEAVVYSTHSHLFTHSRINLATYRGRTGSDDARPELIAQYLVEHHGLLPELVNHLRIAQHVDYEDPEASIEVEHEPIPKYRMVMPLVSPFQVRTVVRQGRFSSGTTLHQIKRQWKNALDALAAELGVRSDPRCSDLARAYYLPSHPPGVAFVTEHFPGRYVDLTLYGKAKANERTDKQHTHCPFKDEHSDPDEHSRTFDHPDEQPLEVDRRITKYQEKWAVINAGGKVLVLNMAERDILKALLAEPDFKRLHRHDYSIQEDARGREVTVYWAEQFIKRPPPGTKFFTDGFCFKPGGNNDFHSFNLYGGLHQEPSASGSCDLFRELIFNVWACGDQQLGEWLWEYLLHLVAKPGERVRTSIALRGAQGAGKSIVFDMLRDIFRDMLLVVDNQNLVLGTFNESLVGKLVVVCEEAAFAGDRSAFQRMKNLITGSTIHINPKHKAPIAVENFARVFLLSNEDHFLHLEPGDRRYTIIEASDAWKGSSMYEQMLQQWRSGGARRFVWEAINHQFRIIPGTQTLVINNNFSTTHAASQLSQSRDPLQQAIVDLLLRGEFVSLKDGVALGPMGDFYWRMDEEQEIESVQLQAHLRAVLYTLAPHRVEHLCSLKRIIRELERFCGRIESRTGKSKDVAGLWRANPVRRVLPTRRQALNHALANGTHD